MARLINDQKQYSRRFASAGDRAELILKTPASVSANGGIHLQQVSGISFEAVLQPLARAIYEASETKYAEPRPWAEATRGEQRECLLLALASVQWMKAHGLAFTPGDKKDRQ